VDNAGDMAFSSTSGGATYVCQIGIGAPLAGTSNSLWIQPGTNQFAFNAYISSTWTNTAVCSTTLEQWTFPFQANFSAGVAVTGKISNSQWGAQFPFFETAGPLPLSTTITTHGGSILLLISGSCYAATAGTVVGFTVAIDGVTKTTAKVYANAASTHVSVVAVPYYASYGGVAAGSHTLALTAITGTTTDSNDFFSVSIFEFPW
jgi:hypothetical protein